MRRLLRTLTYSAVMALACFAASAQAPPVPHDEPSSAAQLMISVPVAFDNTNATARDQEAIPEVNPGPGSNGPGGSCEQQDGWCAFETGVQNTVWFTFEAPASGCVDIATDTTRDLQLAVWDVSDPANFATFVELAANDDSGPGLSPFINDLSCLVPDRTYYVQLDGFAGQGGAGNLIVTECGAETLAVDAGDCQTRLLNDGDDLGDVNYLVPTLDGGVVPRACIWSVDDGDGNSILSQSGCSLAVQPDTTTVYCVDATDATGCTVSDCATVQVIDVVCHQSGKTELCHLPPGNPENPQELCLPSSAVADHLTNHEGDSVGPCGLDCTATNPAFDDACVDLIVKLTTDLFGAETSWELIDLNEGVLLDSRAPGSLAGSTTYTDTYCGDPTRCYEARFHDSFGDGICCSSGPGNYWITLDGAITMSPSGGAFGSDETVFVGVCSEQASAAAAQDATASSDDAQTAVGFVIREQLGTVSAIASANATPATKSLPQKASASISVPDMPGDDDPVATATTVLTADVIRVALTADVREFGNEGAAKGRVVVQFSLDQKSAYEVPLAQTDVDYGVGPLGERAFIVLSNDDGVIFSKVAGDDAVRCNLEHPNPTLCEVLARGAYTLELQASAYAPEGCDECSSLAVKATSEVEIRTVP